MTSMSWCVAWPDVMRIRQARSSHPTLSRQMCCSSAAVAWHPTGWCWQEANCWTSCRSLAGGHVQGILLDLEGTSLPHLKVWGLPKVSHPCRSIPSCLSRGGRCCTACACTTRHTAPLPAFLAALLQE